MRVMRDLVGHTLSGRYRLISRLAGGGMGEVYKAHDLLLDRAVAVKVLQPSLAGDPALVQRFKDEARAAARLSHTNVVAVYDWGCEDDVTYYMVMEYVAGSDLRDVLVRRSSLEPGQAATVIASVCDALAAAHATGLVHRDVKPENVLIDRSGTVKVADFGIAVVADLDRTAPGAGVPGTLRYIAPEQARGEDASAASDVWSAGAVLWELLTGTPPQQGAGAELLRRRATEPVPRPSSFDGRVPKAIDRIVARACAIAVEQRYASAAEMAQDLRRAAEATGPGAAPVRDLVDDLTGEIRLPDMEPTDFVPRRRRFGGRRRRMWPAVVALALAALAVLGIEVGPSLLAVREVAVPQLTGMSRQAAAARAERLGLEIDVEGAFFDTEVAPGHVLSQKPSRGKIAEGSAVEVVLSKGKPYAKIPDVTGMRLSTARVRLRAAELDPGRVGRRYAMEPEGTVLRQRPAKGELRWGSSVKLVVSRGPRPIAVPNVVGLALDDARSMLKKQGFGLAVVKDYSNQIEQGKVISTTPVAGATAPEGGDITVVVSIGPKYKTFKLPDVRNMSLRKARSKLQALNLRVSVRQSCNGKGDTVIETDPLPGAKVKERQRIALFVC